MNDKNAPPANYPDDGTVVKVYEAINIILLVHLLLFFA